jgi:hypothetical protein
MSRELLQEALNNILKMRDCEADEFDVNVCIGKLNQALALPAPASAEPDWRQRELAHVVEECKRIRNLHAAEMRDAVTELRAWVANRLTVAPTPAVGAEPVAFVITDEKINHLQVNTIRKTVERCKHAHHTDLQLRINGKDEWLQADWVKHMQIAAAPTPEVEQRTDGGTVAAIVGDDYSKWNRADLEATLKMMFQGRAIWRKKAEEAQAKLAEVEQRVTRCGDCAAWKQDSESDLIGVCTIGSGMQSQTDIITDCEHACRRFYRRLAGEGK